MTSKKIIVVTGASSGFGRLSANALALAGHTVYASMRETTGRNAPQVADVEKYAGEHDVDLRAIELDVGSQSSVDAGIAKIIAEHGRIDVVPPDADASAVADAIVKVVDTPFGKRPFRVHIDPSQDGADVAFAVIDRVRTEMLHRVGLSDLLTPKVST